MPLPCHIFVLPTTTTTDAHDDRRSHHRERDTTARGWAAHGGAGVEVGAASRRGAIAVSTPLSTATTGRPSASLRACATLPSTTAVAMRDSVTAAISCIRELLVDDRNRRQRVGRSSAWRACIAVVDGDNSHRARWDASRARGDCCERGDRGDRGDRCWRLLRVGTEVGGRHARKRDGNYGYGSVSTHERVAEH